MTQRLDEHFEEWLDNREASPMVDELRQAYLAGAHDTARRIIKGEDAANVYGEICETLHEHETLN